MILEYINKNKDIIVISSSLIGIICVLFLVGCVINFRYKSTEGPKTTKNLSTKYQRKLIKDLITNPHDGISEFQTIYNYVFMSIIIILSFGFIAFMIKKYM